MRPGLSAHRVAARATVAVALCLATAAALGLVPQRDRDSGRDRDLAVRLTRSGPIRLDAHESLPHSHEETEPAKAFSGLVVGQAAVEAVTDAGATPHAPAVLTAAARIDGPDRYRIAPPADLAALVLRADFTLPPGRAPPRA